MDREGQIHEGFYIAHDGIKERVDLKGLTGGNTVIVYGQTELTRDLYDGRDRLRGVVIHDADDVKPHDFDTAPPVSHLSAARRDGPRRLRLHRRLRRVPRRELASRSRKTGSASSSAHIRSAGWACSRKRSLCRRS